MSVRTTIAALPAASVVPASSTGAGAAPGRPGEHVEVGGGGGHQEDASVLSVAAAWAAWRAS